MRKLLTVVGAAAVLAFAASGAEAAKLKACFVYIGPHNDGGWSQQHDSARLEVEKALGDKVETSFVENVPEGPDAERAIERLARSGCGIVFTTSFGFMDPTLKVAAKFPNVKFEHCTGFKTADNVSTYNLRWYEGRYVMGQIAAAVDAASRSSAAIQWLVVIRTRISEYSAAGQTSFPLPQGEVR